MRSILGISQSELAKKANISQPVISDLESGRSQTCGHTSSIANVLGVNAYWLETGRDQMPEFASYSRGDDLVIPVVVAPGNCGGLR